MLQIVKKNVIICLEKLQLSFCNLQVFLSNNYYFKAHFHLELRRNKMNRLSIAIIILFLTSGLYAKAVIKKSELHSLLNEQQQIAKMFSNYYKESHKNNKQAIKKMKTFIYTFGKNQNKLTGHSKNNKLIQQKLSSIAEQWEASNDLSKKAKHDGMIKSMMSGIGKDIKELRKLYSKTY